MCDNAEVKNIEDYIEAVTASSAKRQTGFLAQEVDSLAQVLGYEFSGVHRPSTAEDHYTIGYEQFVVPLVKAVQEQQAQLDEVRREQEVIKALLHARSRMDVRGGPVNEPRTSVETYGPLD